MRPPTTPSAPVVARLAPWFAIATVFACGIRLLTAPGTADVSELWLSWMAQVNEHGPITGYALIGSDYSPLVFVVLFALAKAAQAFGWTDFLALKLGIAVFAMGSVAIFGIWCRSLIKTVAFAFAILVSSLALGYLDVLYLPPLILAVAAMRRRQMLLAGVCLALAFAVKWHPLIVAPFFLIEAWIGATDMRVGPRDRRTGARAAAVFLAGTLLVMVPLAAIFGADPMWTSLSNAMDRTELSAQALNANWIVQWIYQSWSGAGADTPIAMPAGAAWAARIVFAGSYIALLTVYAKVRRNFDDFLWYATAAATAYFTLNIGVHENHLFVGLALAFCLYGNDARLGPAMALFTAVAFNVNLLVFYAIDGSPLFYTPLFDAVALTLSALNTLFMGACLWQAALDWGQSRQVERPA